MDPPVRDEEVEVAAGSVSVAGHLTIPEHPGRDRGVRARKRQQPPQPPQPACGRGVEPGRAGHSAVRPAQPDEELNRANVFDIDLLAGRLVDVTGWLAGQPDTTSLPVGYFGASTGAGAALVAAADPRVDVVAVVSRGGRPDLAGDSLARVGAPTLLIVGGSDDVVLEMNRRAQAAMPGECELAVVRGARCLQGHRRSDRDQRPGRAGA